MKNRTKLLILATVFLVVCVPFVSAWNVDRYATDPSGSLAPDTPVKVSFGVEFPVNTSETTFPAGSDLVMTTDLVNPAWSYTITTSDGGSAVTSGFYNQTLDLSGIILSYKGQGSEVMSVTLKGTTPHMSTPASATILDVHEVDKIGNVVAGSRVTKTVVISDSVQASTTNPTMNEQSGVFDQIIRMIKSLFGMQP